MEDHLVEVLTLTAFGGVKLNIPSSLILQQSLISIPILNKGLNQSTRNNIPPYQPSNFP